MANEATINTTLTIVKQSSDGTKRMIDYQSRPSSFRINVDGTKGPTPGSLTIPTGGKIVSLEELTTPGLCRIHNQDDTNYIIVGIWEEDSDEFHPLIEVGPGETYVVKLWRGIGEEYEGTGTGTSAPINHLFAKAIGADVVANFEAFEK